MVCMRTGGGANAQSICNVSSVALVPLFGSVISFVLRNIVMICHPMSGLDFLRD